MSKARALEIINQRLEMDQQDCRDFQEQHAYRYPPMEARVDFMEFRLKRWLGALVNVVHELSAEDRPTGDAP